MAEVDTEPRTTPSEVKNSTTGPVRFHPRNVSLIADLICLGLFCLLDLKFNVSVNNFSVRSRRSYRVLGMNKGVNLSCSMTQHSTTANPFRPYH